ncbi:MAG TPA: PadR family transcriptional regulator [Longimicrobiales bacterium]|nr:PadR family transcriptional regulator [Longimicrobiales bacterium]
MGTADELLPLSPLSMEILVALAGGDLHGYAIIQAVHAQTGGRRQPGAGTMYAALDRMLSADMIREVTTADDRTARRRSYAITPFGRQVARAEARRLATLLELAAERRLIRRPVT